MRKGITQSRPLLSNFVLLSAILATAVHAQSNAVAQSTAGIPLNPGERLVAINGVPVASAPQGVAATPRVVQSTPAVSQPASPSGVVQASAQTQTNIVGNLAPSNQPFSHTPGASALEKANAERRRYGRGPLLPDPQLQALALRKATIAAQRRYKNHIGGSLGSAKCEGVGHTNGRFLTCCLDEHGTYGGAAMVQGPDGWYCCLLVR